MSFATEGNTNDRSLERVADAGVSSGSKVEFEFKCNVFKAAIQGTLLSGLWVSARQNVSFAENELFPLEACQNRVGKTALCSDEEELGQ